MMGATAGVAALAMPRVLRAQDKPTLVTSIRSLSNPYHAVWKTGAEAYAKWRRAGARDAGLGRQ